MGGTTAARRMWGQSTNVDSCAPSMMHVPPLPPLLVSAYVFLGGSCDPTTWRNDIAVPELTHASIPYFNPHVLDWHPNLITLEARAKELCDVLLFVIDSKTRAIASMLEATEYILSQRRVVIVILDIPEGARIDGDLIEGRQLKDLNRARAFLCDIAARHQKYCDVFDSVENVRKTRHDTRRTPTAHEATLCVRHTQWHVTTWAWAPLVRCAGLERLTPLRTRSVLSCVRSMSLSGRQPHHPHAPLPTGDALEHSIRSTTVQPPPSSRSPPKSHLTNQLALLPRAAYDVSPRTQPTPHIFTLPSRTWCALAPKQPRIIPPFVSILLSHPASLPLETPLSLPFYEHIRTYAHLHHHPTPNTTTTIIGATSARARRLLL